MIDATTLSRGERSYGVQVEGRRCLIHAVCPRRATMLADLDLLLITVYCAADDTLPTAAANARRRVTAAEIVTLAVAQAVLDIPSDRAFLRAAARRLGGLFPQLPRQDGYWKRRTRLAEAIEALMAAFPRDSPGHRD